MARRLMVADDNTETLPAGWHDEVVIHTMRRNPNGTLSVIALVNVYGDDGKMWSGETVMRLRRQKGAKS